MSSNLAKSALWVTISEIIFNISGFIIHSIVGRILGPADYGRYGLVITLTTMIIILIGNGIPTAMSKYISEVYDTNPKLVKVIKKQSIILQSLIIGMLTIIFYLSAPLIAKILHDPSLTPLFQISAWIIPTFAMASFYFSYYTGLHEFNIQSLLKTLRSIFKIVFIIGLAYYFRVPGSINGYTISTLVLFIVAVSIDKFVILKKLKKIEKKIALKGEQFFDWRKLVNYAWQVVIFFLAYELLISIDLYLVKGILRDDYLTGIYNASLTVGRIPYYVFYALTVILLPVISKTTSENNMKKTAEIINQSLRLMLILLVPSVILMSIYSRPIIRFFYSSRFVDAAYPMSILVWGVGFLTIFYVFCFVMSGAGKVKKPMLISILGLALNTVLNYILIKKYGITGSAIATSITSAIITFFMLYHVWIDFGVKIKIQSFLKVSLAGFVMYMASMLFNRGEFIFILWSVILFSLYMVVLILLGEIKKADIVIVRSMIARKKVSRIKEGFSGNEPSA
jgi:stage V sporulation protein B